MGVHECVRVLGCVRSSRERERGVRVVMMGIREGWKSVPLIRESERVRERATERERERIDCQKWKNVN